MGVFWGEFAKREPAANRALLNTLMQGQGGGPLSAGHRQHAALTELPTAFARLAARDVVGKLVLTT